MTGNWFRSVFIAIMAIMFLIHLSNGYSQQNLPEGDGNSSKVVSSGYVNFTTSPNGTELYLLVTKHDIIVDDNSSEKLSILAISWDNGPVNGTEVRFSISWYDEFHYKYVEVMNETHLTNTLGYAQVIFTPVNAGRYLVRVQDEHGNIVTDHFTLTYYYPLLEFPVNTTTNRKYIALPDTSLQMRFPVFDKNFRPVNGNGRIVIQENYSTEILNESISSVNGVVNFTLDLSRYGFDNGKRYIFGVIRLKFGNGDDEVSPGYLEISSDDRVVKIEPSYVVLNPGMEADYAVHGYRYVDQKPLNVSRFSVSVFWLNRTEMETLNNAGFLEEFLKGNALNSTDTDYIRTVASNVSRFSVKANLGVGVFNLTVPQWAMAGLVEVNGSHSIIATQNALKLWNISTSDYRIELETQWERWYDSNTKGFIPEDNFTVMITLYNSTGYVPNSTVYVYSEGGGKAVKTNSNGRANVSFRLINSVLNTSDNIMVLALYRDCSATAQVRLPEFTPYRTEITPEIVNDRLYIEVSNFYLGNSTRLPFILEVRRIDEDGRILEDVFSEFINASTASRVLNLSYGSYEISVFYKNEFGYHKFRKRINYTPIHPLPERIFLLPGSNFTAKVRGNDGGVVYLVENGRFFNGTHYTGISLSQLSDGAASLDIVSLRLLRDARYHTGIAFPDFSLPRIEQGEAVITDRTLPDLALFYHGPSTVNSGGNIPINITIMNLGTSSSSQIDLGIYLNGAFLGNYRTGSIPAGGALEYTINLSLPAGFHNVTAVADPDNIISELDENNNRLTFHLLAERAYNVTGSISLSGLQGICSVYVVAYSRFFEEIVAEAPVKSSTFTIPLRNGTYTLLAFADMDCDGVLDSNEPVGYGFNRTVFDGPGSVVVNGSDISRVDITLTPGLTLRGDVNEDWKVDISDLVEVTYIMFGKTMHSLKADFNSNGRIDIGDLTRLGHYLMNRIDTL